MCCHSPLGQSPSQEGGGGVGVAADLEGKGEGEGEADPAGSEDQGELRAPGSVEEGRAGRRPGVGLHRLGTVR